MLICGDLHLDAKLGNIRTLDLFNEKKEKFLSLINKEDMVVFLGDYFNSPEPQNEFRKAFSDFVSKIKVPKRFILGNHDIDNETEQNSLVAIEAFLQNEIVDTYEKINDDIILVSYMFDYDKLYDVISKTEAKYIIGHFSFEYEINNRQLKGELSYSNKLNDKQFILGHIHKFQQKDNVAVLGAFAPHKLDELEYDFKIGFLRDNQLSFKNIKYNIKQKEINKIEDLDDIDDRTSVTIKIKNIEDKKKIISALKDKKIMNVKYEIDSPEININKFNMDELLKEYLVKLGRGDLFDKVKSFIESKNISVLEEESITLP